MQTVFFTGYKKMKNLYTLAMNNNKAFAILNSRKEYILFFPVIGIPASGLTNKTKNEISRQTSLAKFITDALNKRGGHEWISIETPTTLTNQGSK